MSRRELLLIPNHSAQINLCPSWKGQYAVRGLYRFLCMKEVMSQSQSSCWPGETVTDSTCWARHATGIRKTEKESIWISTCLGSLRVCFRAEPQASASTGELKYWDYFWGNMWIFCGFHSCCMNVKYETNMKMLLLAAFLRWKTFL